MYMGLYTNTNDRVDNIDPRIYMSPYQIKLIPQETFLTTNIFFRSGGRTFIYLKFGFSEPYACAGLGKREGEGEKRLEVCLWRYTVCATSTSPPT